MPKVNATVLKSPVVSRAKNLEEGECSSDSEEFTVHDDDSSGEILGDFLEENGENDEEKGEDDEDVLDDDTLAETTAEIRRETGTKLLLDDGDDEVYNVRLANLIAQQEIDSDDADDAQLQGLYVDMCNVSFMIIFLFYFLSPKCVSFLFKYSFVLCIDLFHEGGLLLPGKLWNELFPYQQVGLKW